MLEFIGALSSLGFLVSLVGAILFLIKRNSAWKKWLLTAAICFLVFLITAFLGLPHIS